METTTYAEADIPAIAAQVLAAVRPDDANAAVLALQGELGAGKTTLTKELLKQLGVQETVVSPTFVIAKFYEPQSGGFDRVMHMDAYRIESLDELGPLGWSAVLEQPKTLVVVEWPEKIAGALPEQTVRFLLEHLGEHRTITKQ